MQQTIHQRIHHGKRSKANLSGTEKVIKKYNPLLIARSDDASHYDLWSTKDVEIVDRGRDDLYLPD